MRFVKGDLWESGADLILVTTNASVNRNGELVMGRGAALEAKGRYPWLAKAMGATLKAYEQIEKPFIPIYSFPVCAQSVEEVLHMVGAEENLCATHQRHPRVGCFPVKVCWHEAARLDLIRYGAKILAYWWGKVKEPHPYGPEYGLPEGFRIAMNFPGIGYGQLTEDEVRPILIEELEGVPVDIYQR